MKPSPFHSKKVRRNIRRVSPLRSLKYLIALTLILNLLQVMTLHRIYQLRSSQIEVEQPANTAEEIAAQSIALVVSTYYGSPA